MQYNISKNATGDVIIGSTANITAGNYVQLNVDGTVTEYINHVANPFRVASVIATMIKPNVVIDTTLGVKPTIAQCAAAMTGILTGKVIITNNATPTKAFLVIDIGGIYTFEKLTFAI